MGLNKLFPNYAIGWVEGFRVEGEGGHFWFKNIFFHVHLIKLVDESWGLSENKFGVNLSYFLFSKLNHRTGREIRAAKGRGHSLGSNNNLFYFH